LDIKEWLSPEPWSWGSPSGMEVFLSKRLSFSVQVYAPNA
jgi:hypothetical protein